MRNRNFMFGLLLLVGIVVTAFTYTKRHAENKEAVKSNYEITKKWELPPVLNEISGIAWIDKNLIACIQDEDGVVFIYDLNRNKIVDEFQFSGPGDYEGIAVKGKDAYVMRSDGVLFQVKNYKSGNRSSILHHTSFSANNNMESLTLDPKTGNLLTIPKDQDTDETFKSLYQISFNEKSVDTEPITKILMNAEELKKFRNKKIYKTFSPSDIAVNPLTSETYILEGKNPKLLVLDTKGNIKKLYELDKQVFQQPEGITFSPDGRLYISNEAGKEVKANIIEVSFLE